MERGRKRKKGKGKSKGKGKFFEDKLQQRKSGNVNNKDLGNMQHSMQHHAFA